MDIIKVFALGGLDEKGRDSYVVEINDDIFVIDAGTLIADKTLPGIDFIIPNPEYLLKNKHRIKGYILTHGHDENLGALKYFYNIAPAPIYCSFATKSILLYQASIYKIKTNFQFHVVNASDTVTISGHTVHFFQTCHNMAYSSGVAFETSQGNIVYTGDFIIDYTVSEPGYTFDFRKLSQIAEKPTLLLLSESKSANKAGYCSPKHRIRAIIKNYFKDDKRIFITCFWQNLYRIHEIAKLCRDFRKKVYFYDAYTRQIIEEYQKIIPVFNPSDIVQQEDLLRVRNQDLVILMLGHDASLYSEVNVLASGNNKDTRIKIMKDDIFISAAIPTPTMELACTHSIDNLYRTGCQVVWVKDKQVSSMHACQDDIRLMLTTLRPKYYFPVRGTFVNLMANAKLALSTGIGLNHMNVFVIDNGMQIVFDGVKRPQIIAPESAGINISPLLVDGKGVANIGANIIEERKKLSFDGAVVIASVVSISKKRIVAGPDCQMRGFVYVKEAEPLLKSITNIYVDEINNAFKTSDKPDFEKVKAAVSERARKMIKRENGREPYIVPIINIED